GDAAHVERRSARGDQGAAAPLGALDEGVPRGSGRERRRDRRFREGRGPANLQVVQLPGGVPPGARLVASGSHSHLNSSQRESVVRENTLRKIWARGEAVVNGWLSIPSSFSAGGMAPQGFDSLAVDSQPGVGGRP